MSNPKVTPAPCSTYLGETRHTVLFEKAAHRLRNDLNVVPDADAQAGAGMLSSESGNAAVANVGLRE